MWYDKVKGSRGRRKSSEGTKKVAEREKEEEEMMLVKVLKSPAPIRASIMLLSC